jgi:hypothetical protein
MVTPCTDRIVSLVAATAMMSVVAIYAYRRGADAQRSELPPAVAPDRPAAVAPEAAVTGTAGPAQAPGRPPLPAVSVPCVDDRAELRTGDSGDPILCWGDRCVDGGGIEGKAPPPPATAASDPAPVVGPELVCTGTRCDRLGRRLRAVLAKPDPDRRVSATRDHRAIVIQSVLDDDEIWDRASDRRIEPGESPVVDFPQPDTHPESIDVVGNLLLVAWGCHEWCSSLARILDSRGRDTGTDSVEIAPAVPHGVSRIGSRIFAAGEDRYLVFGLFGEVALIDHGRVMAQSSLVSSDWSPGQVDVRVIPGRDGAMNAMWCRVGYCHLSRIVFIEQGRSRWQLELVDHAVFPRCPGAEDPAWPPRASDPAP